MHTNKLMYSLDTTMEIICQIHPIEFQLYHDIGQMIQLNSLQRPKASDVRSIVREELTEKTYIYINQKLIFFIFQQIFSRIVFILLYTNDYPHPHPQEFGKHALKRPKKELGLWYIRTQKEHTRNGGFFAFNFQF